MIEAAGTRLKDKLSPARVKPQLAKIRLTMAVASSVLFDLH